MQDLIYYLFSLLPTAICMELVLSYLVRSGRTKTENLIMHILICIGAYTFVEVLCKSGEASLWAAYGMAVCTYTMPLVPILSIYYISALAERPVPERRQKIVVSTCLGYGLLTTVMLLLSDPQEAVVAMQNNWGLLFAARHLSPGVVGVYQMLIGPCLWGISFIGAVVFTIRAARLFIQRESRWGQLYRFLFKGEGITPFYLNVFLAIFFTVFSYARLLTPTYVMVDYPISSVVYGVCLAILLHFLGHLGRYTYMDSITIKTQYTTRLLQEAEGEASAEIISDLPSVTDDTMERLQQRMVHLIEGEFWFLHKDVSLELVAQELMTNRVYVSRILNRRMQTTFRDYINHLRIDYAKGWVAQHPNDDTDTVADVCGFNDVQRFLLKFKQYNGITYDEWRRQPQPTIEA